MSAHFVCTVKCEYRLETVPVTEMQFAGELDRRKQLKRRVSEPWFPKERGERCIEESVEASSARAIGTTEDEGTGTIKRTESPRKGVSRRV